MFSGVQTAQASDWGCTIFVCLASPTNPMSIPTCAEALLKIRPWKKPTCSAARDIRNEIVTRQCPEGFFYERELIDEREQITRIPNSRDRRGICMDTYGRTMPAGEYSYWHAIWDFNDGQRYEVYREVQG